MEKVLIGKFLGEIYRIQKRINPRIRTVSDATIYGLINGVEEAIDQELNSIKLISQEKLSKLRDVLDKYHNDENELKNLQGYYDIEDDLNEVGISRWEAITMLSYLKAGNRYEEVINKFNSSSSPVECKNFDLDDDEI